MSDDEAAGFTAGHLPARQRRAIAEHVDVCAPCRRLVSALVAAAEPVTPSQPAAPPDDARLHTGQVLGRFSLTRLLGHGAMGEVWAARDRELDREVALKFLRLPPGALRTEATVRLRREAQAMARLNHPNVVAVYELGAADDDHVFCAMELVDGVTLRCWLETPRSWRDVLGVACTVARGIAAAHAVGLIHRDVKPENILIASGGRTVVSDFGLAKLADLGTGSGDVGDTDGADDALDTAAISLTGSLTATGAMIGTPVYMAPEQLAGDRADARSDQFSYCVMIHEALFGARPFAGETFDELAQDIRRGPRKPPRLGGIPKGIVRCLERGLAADPAARWPSMTRLVDELERAARRPRQRRIAALVAVAVATAVAGTAIATRDPFEAARTATEQRIANVWNPARAAALQTRFTGSGAPLAREQAATTIKLLDAYRAAWIAQRLDAWSATHVRRQQTPDILERRLACFDQLADAMDGLVALFLAPGIHDIEDAPQIVYRLEPVATCGNLDRLLARSLVPGTPATMETERALRELQVGQIAGRHADVLQRASSLIAAATTRGEPAVLARARFHLGWAQAAGGHLVDAETTLQLAVQEGAAARDHYLVAECWLRLLEVTGFQLLHLDVAAAIEPAVRAAVAQAGNDPRQLADLAKALGLIAIARSDLQTAHARFTEARDRRIAARGPNDPSVANDESNLAAILSDLGRRDEAVQHIERVISIIHGAFGDYHPVLAQAEHNLATLAGDRHDWATAERHARAAVAMNVRVRGAAHPDVAMNRIHLARFLREQKRFSDARAELTLAREILASALPPDHPSVTEFDLYVAQVAEAEGHRDEAVRIARGVVEAARRGGIPRSLRFALAELARMVAYTAPRDALPLYEEAAGMGIELKAPLVSEVEFLREFADVALRVRQPAAAIKWFDRMPDAAKQLADVRRQLDRASAGHR
jgi:tetratricopeptide (TPR) repeat protein